MTESVSVVVPAFNEAGVLEELVRQLEEQIVRALDAVEVILVDDCSTDSTPQILAALSETRAWLRVERSESNRGHGPSVVRGLELGTSEWIFQLDSDAQFLVRDFWELWRRREHADLVLGVRVLRRDPRHRLLLSHAVQLVVSSLARRRVRDANTPFRLMRRSVWNDLRQFVPPGTLAPAIFVVAGALVRGYNVVEVPVTHLPRTRGSSSLRSVRLLRFSLRGLGQLLRFRNALAHAPPRPGGPG